MTGWAVATPPVVATWDVRDADALAGTRQQLESTVRSRLPVLDRPQHQEMLSHVVLVASELVTNALRHTDGPARLDLMVAEGSLLVSVLDHRPDVPPVLSPDRDLGQGGFGLQLAMRVADDVGWFRTDGGKRVWARFAVPAVEVAPRPAPARRGPRRRASTDGGR
ncbi:histidine kinase-like protein [Isoptericola jiangsuensis]|uniref:Histidine kinase-like protein n=1 Tax=Isoptericola jiangsuensis TaxID=548579 RepID=A0A2A9ETC8_9MICO|nr:ATP-binding protein [Isoptericola jiangsuensis]PFG42003.1 histidine kinase-like protein [Isoptericola jiangsuensis]